jgi:hypothetical protein
MPGTKEISVSDLAHILRDENRCLLPHRQSFGAGLPFSQSAGYPQRDQHAWRYR